MPPELQFGQFVWVWIGLAVCVALAAGIMRGNRRRERDLERLAHSRLLGRLTESFSRRRRILRQILWLVALMLVFVAIARPQYGFEFREVKRRGIDLVFAVDTSRSMLAEDVAPNRLERSRLAISDFIDRLEGDRIGLIPFAGNAFSLCPLTLDYGAFRQSLDALDTDIIPHQGTDLASAVREANRLFDEEGNNHRILILITDGEDLQGAVLDALATAREKGMIIHTVGVGDSRGALIPITNEDGSQDFVRDESGQPVKSALDEKTMSAIAEATGGIYAPLGRAGEGLNRIYLEKLRLVPKTEMDQRLDRIPLERYEWPLAAALLLLVMEFLLSERRTPRSRSVPIVSAARRVLSWPGAREVAKQTAAVAAIFGLAGVAAFAETSPAESEEPPVPAESLSDDPRDIYNAGTESYRKGDFEQAEALLGRGLAKTPDLDLQQRAYYNLGNARFRLGQQSLEHDPGTAIRKWEASVKAYEDALALNPKDEDAAFNRDFVGKKLEELKKQRNQNQEQQNPDQQDQKKEQNRDQNQEEQNHQEQEEQEQRDSHDSQKSPDSGKKEEKEKDEKESQQSEQQEEKKEAQSPEQKSGSGEEQKEKEEPEKSQPQPARPTEFEGQKEKADPQPGDGELSEERRAPGEMSREEAAQLLEALENDERTVIPLPDAKTYRRTVPNNTTKGKTW